MHNEIFQFEIFKNFMKILKYFKTPFLKCFMKLLIFNIKWLKTSKNMIKVYQVRRYIMLFMHSNKYLPLTGLLTLLQWTIHNTAWNLEKFQKYFMKYFTAKNVTKFYITSRNTQFNSVDWSFVHSLMYSIWAGCQLSRRRPVLFDISHYWWFYVRKLISLLQI